MTMFTKALLTFLFLTALEGTSFSSAATIDQNNQNLSTSSDIFLSDPAQISFNCTKHSDCNPVLRNLLTLISGESEETDPKRKRQELSAFQTLHRNPKIFCLRAQCHCYDESKTFDPVDQICRQRCEVDVDCQSNGPQIGMNLAKQNRNKDPLMVGPDDDLNVIGQICAPDRLCRCPPNSQLDMLNQSRCIVGTAPLLATSLTIFSILILFTITAIPVWTMVKKHRDYIQQKRLFSNRSN